mmetsp:Transcript_166966/g.536033  ORF Transcript_166966/g.536033 Transcript_166966/m.536033 type:complete len:436 (-) Transcript_166966:40-1347(-)
MACEGEAERAPQGRGSGTGKDQSRGAGRGGRGRWRGGGARGGGAQGASSGDSRPAPSAEESWDAPQLRSLEGSAAAAGGLSVADLARSRPQRPVEAFPGVTVAADWPDRSTPKSGSAFYLPLIWSALVLDRREDAAEEGDGRRRCPALDQLASLGDAKHFHGGSARRATAADLWAAQAFWQQVFSAWSDWVRRLRASLDQFPGGRDAVVAAFVQRLSVTACAVVYGDLRVLGALPHISNARRNADQDSMLEMDFGVRIELEASIATLFLPGGVSCVAGAGASFQVNAGSLGASSSAPPQSGGSSCPSGGGASRSGAALVAPAAPDKADVHSVAAWAAEAAMVLEMQQGAVGGEELNAYMNSLTETLKRCTTAAPPSIKDAICSALAPAWDVRANCPAGGDLGGLTLATYAGALRDLASRMVEAGQSGAGGCAGSR